VLLISDDNRTRMGRSSIEPSIDRNSAVSGARRLPRIKVTAGGIYAALIIALSAWVLHSFLEAMVAACVTAIASWPLYRRFIARMPSRMSRSAASLIFTAAITVFVLAPMMFALAALLAEAHALFLKLAAADQDGIAVPYWVQEIPAAGQWLAARWESELAHPGGLSVWLQRIDAAAFLTGAQSLGQFLTRHLMIILFTILVLFFLYQEGESLADAARRVLRDRIGDRADGYIELATKALRASVNSVLVVGLFDGFACWAVYAITGVPHAALWAAITGALALVPFLGYAAIAALTLQLTLTGAATAALLPSGLGCAVLFCGDKIVRPAVAREGTRLPFVWVLMGCLGGFEVLGLAGLVLGPVLLALTRELWEQRIRDIALAEATPSISPQVDRDV
jgi:predicted PurR-regulated permease PerM